MFFIAVFVIEHINGRFWLNDFKVYYSAAQALLNGTQVYGQSFGLSTGFYKYSPFTLLCFSPTTLLSFELACAIHFFVIAICTICSFLLIQSLLRITHLSAEVHKENAVLYIGFICIVNHLTRELHLGNVNMLIVFLVSACLYFNAKNQYLFAGISLGLALLIKPYLLVLALPLFLYKKYKILFYTIVSIATAILSFTILFGLSYSYNLHLEWLRAMIEHNSYLISHHTVFSILNQIGVLFAHQNQQLYLLAFVGLTYVGTYFSFIHKHHETENNQQNLIVAFFIFLSMLPNILITDTEHFLFCLPVIIIVLNYLMILKNNFFNVLFILIILAYGANSSDLLGNHLSDNFENWGVLGIGNLALISLLLYLHVNSKKLTTLITS